MKDNWKNYELRIRSEARAVLKNNKSNGLAIVTSHMLVNSEGTPIAWVVPSGKRIEPTKETGNIIEALLEVLTNGKVD